METLKNIARSLRVTLVSGLIMIGSVIKAQPTCDLHINNNMDCPVDVTVYIFENPSLCGQCSGSPIVFNMSANSNITITCTDISTTWGCTLSLCNLQAQIVGPGLMGSATAVWGGASQTISGTAGCTVNNPNLHVAGNDININP